MKLSFSKVVPLALALGLSGACVTKHHQLGGTNDGFDGGSGAGGGSNPPGGTGGGPNPGGPNQPAPRAIPLEETRTRYPAAICDGLRACLGDMFGLYFEGENCLDIAEGIVADDFPRLQSLIADGKVKYDGMRAEACFAALASQACSDDREREPCTEMLDGTVAIGGACSSNAECQGGDTYCKNEGTCPGRCAPLESADGSCSTNEDCQSGLRCNRVDRSCFRPAGAGERCGGGVSGGGQGLECSAGLFCLGADRYLLLPGTCRTIEESFSGSSGDPCFGDAALCQPDLRCVEAARGGHCGPPVSSGAACKIAGPEMCPDGEYCAADYQATVDGTCTPKPGAGEACARRAFDTFCAPGTICDTGTCRPRQNLGGSCESYRVCHSEHCLNGFCAPKGACE